MLSEASILMLLEQGRQQHPVRRVLLLLRAIYPEQSYTTLAALPLGERNRLVRDIRAALLGPEFPAYQECPKCQQGQEFELELHTLGPVGLTEHSHVPFDAVVGGWPSTLRLPSTGDLMAVVQARSLEDARQTLVERCVLVGGPADRPELEPMGWIEQVSQALEQRDPAIALEYELSCARCAATWWAQLDLAEAFWMELQAIGTRLLREVVSLARAFGWTEREVLAVSPWRRRQYLEMVGV